MSRAASSRNADTTRGGFEPDGVFWDQAFGTSAREDRVVPLFASSSSHALDGEANEDEWANAVTLVHTVAAQVRAMQQHSQECVEKAEALAAAAQSRADKAEDCVRRLLTQLRVTEERAQAAEARAAEATTQLRRLHDCLTTEFDNLTRVPSNR